MKPDTPTGPGGRAVDSDCAQRQRPRTVMFRWKRVMFFLFATLAVLVGALYALRNQIADRVLRRVLAYAERVASSGGVQLRDIEFGGAELAGPGVVTCTDLHGRLVFDGSRVRLGADAFRFEIGRVQLSVVEMSPGRMRVGVVDGSLTGVDARGFDTGTGLTQINADWTFPFDWTDADASLGKLLQQVRRLPREGRIAGPARIEAVARFPVAGRFWEVAARTANAGDDAVFTLDRGELTRLAREHRHPLTDAEIDVVARNPLRAPRMLAIAEQATARAIELRRTIRHFPYDAYRHVYWSWLLTREFGPEFSELVTDAHEVGATYESGPANRRMDLHNNAVGRVYALAGVDEAGVLERVLHDENVMRRPDLQTEVQSLRR